DGRFAAFSASVGIDDETLELPRRGSVVFRVQGDGKTLWESSVVRSGERAIAVPDLDLRGVQRMTLEVDFAEGTDVADRADWCDPILLRDAPPASRPAPAPATRRAGR
ncbi:MAG TPA: NPCBM/NEW2 domain-containing protein, partial [Planctomycetota bacterium]|nr:NPCBM/NEW2 domain-containing protein [Planctomycetota bacterium]